MTSNIHNSAVMSSGNTEWLTPPDILERVIRVMGAIDLDPTSDPSRHVPATRHYTAADDCLSREWEGPRVYMNPPYNRTMIRFFKKLRVEVEAKRVTEAILTVPARVDTDWWELVNDWPWCAVHGRVKYLLPDGTLPPADRGSTFPTAILYHGPNYNRFVRAFKDLGRVYRPVVEPAGYNIEVSPPVHVVTDFSALEELLTRRKGGA